MQYVNEKSAYATGFSEMLASVLIADDLPEIYADDVLRRLSYIKPLRGTMSRLFKRENASSVKIELRKNFHDEFLAALDTVYEKGCTVEVSGVSSISTSMKDGDMVYPLMVESTPTQLIVGPSVEPFPITVDTACGKRTANLQRYKTSNDIIIETDSKEIMFIKFVFMEGSHQVQFIYRLQLQFAEDISAVVESYCVAIGILDHFFKPDNEQNISNDLDSLHMIKQFFQTVYSFWKKLSSIGDILDLSFDPAEIGNIEDNIQNVDELYLLLIEKKAVRVNAKLTATESTGITLASSEYAPEIGKAIDLTYISKIKYLICEQTIVVYTANLLTNAIIKEFSKTETGAIKILYGDTDSTPMYISYTGHKTPDGAKIESSLIIKDNERTSKYKDALTVNEYYGQEVN